MTIRDLIDSGKISLDTVVLGELPMTADGVVWPAHLSYVPEKWWMYGGPPSGEYVAPSLAADAFIGGMAAYLVARSDDRLQIVQILAAACKLRNPKPDTLST